ncbi:MAG: bifunctional acetate--CoA ligase family protein/GNAT family N-acetyltransferase [Steroidobacteraceae bacterium]|nr:bifunctional acetate--CoA ligase family protein/GNAT family N-acetyltransferase [Steroidobacteraceae bacterium]
MTARRTEAVLKPASIALVGASDRAGTLGDVIRRNLAGSGFGGAVHFVSDRHASVAGQVAYRSVLDLPSAPDLAIIATPARTVADIVAECGEKGVQGAVIVATGFSANGREDPVSIATLRLRADRHGVRILGPGSLGVIRTDINLNAACGPGQPLPGRLALVSQSGALCAAILDWSRTRHVGFSTLISTGMGADVDFGEILDFLARDPATDSIMLYMEGVENARRFMSALRAAARMKPVLVMKAGRHAERPDSAAFHAGTLVGPDDVFDAAMRRAGVLRIRDFSDLHTAAATLGAGVRVAGRRLAIVSNAGGPGTLAADHATDRWLQLAELAPETRGVLAALLPAGAKHDNPVYVRGDADAAMFEATVRTCLEDPGVDALLAIMAPHALTDPDAFAQALIGIAANHGKPLFTCWMGGESVAASRSRFATHRIPTYATPEAAVDAIAALGMFAANQQLLLQAPEPLSANSAPDRDAARSVVDAALEAGRDWLDPAESKAVLAAFGIPVVRSVPARSASEAARIAQEIGFPVAMKILSPDIPHKTDVGGVRLDLQNASRVRKAYAAMLEEVAGSRPAARLDGVLIEPMWLPRQGRELMIGVVRDPVFGPAICFGLGGMLVEVIRDRAVALPPLNQFLVRDLVRRTRAAQALGALRGAPPADESAVEDILLRVSEIVCELPEVGALDLNPVVVTRSGAVVLDARIGVVRRRPAARPYDHMAIHPYPSELTATLELPEGITIRFRPIRPEDAAIESAFIHGLSEQSRFLRFMFGLHDLTPAMLSRFTQIDYDCEIALIAVIDTPVGEEQIGVARYVTLPDGEACEFAIVVGDRWQGRGIARRLLGMLMDVARDRRLAVMQGVTLRENVRMLELARSLGFETRTDRDELDLVQMTRRLADWPHTAA